MRHTLAPSARETTSVERRRIARASSRLLTFAAVSNTSRNAAPASTAKMRRSCARVCGCSPGDTSTLSSDFFHGLYGVAGASTVISSDTRLMSARTCAIDAPFARRATTSQMNELEGSFTAFGFSVGTKR
jgi:hypothetical protein